MSDSPEPVYDDWPYGTRLELKVTPRWPARYVVGWLIAGVAYGLVMGSITLAIATVITTLNGGDLWPLGWTATAFVALLCVPIPLMSDMDYRQRMVSERFVAQRRDE